MVGAGIYATIGTAAGLMGNAIWLAFLVSMAAALLTGLSYASLASRYPRAGGAAFVVNRAYQKKFLAYVVGLTVTASGLTSMATGSKAFAENLAPFIGVPAQFQLAIVIAFILFLAIVNFIGIKESLGLNIVFTAVEVGGLVLVIAVGARFWGSVNYLETPPDVHLNFGLVMTGAVLAFYGFIGFEDMLNVAEEVKNPKRNMPWGIIIAIAVTTTIYMLISITAVSVVPAAQLAEGKPFAKIMGVAAPWLPGWVYQAIAVFAVANTALLNYIMGSRCMYGMASQGLLPRFLATVHPGRKTPYVAIITLGIVVLILSFFGNVGQLASATSLLLLTCFCLVNCALIILKLRKSEERGSMEIPIVIPALGTLVCLGLIGSRLYQAVLPGAKEDIQRAPIIAIAIIAGISVLYFVLKPKDEAIAEGMD
jgi:amino acid transporter